jgi:hypothetical protein
MVAARNFMTDKKATRGPNAPARIRVGTGRAPVALSLFRDTGALGHVGEMLNAMRDFAARGPALLLAPTALLALACSSTTGAETIDGGPAITITSPADGAPVSIATAAKVPVTFTVAGFTLEAPGGCGAIGDGCGHVIVLVDGTTCDAPGEIFNSIFPFSGSVASPATAIADLGYCPSAASAHTITLALYRDDHTAVGNGASATVTVAADTGTVPTDAGMDAPSDGGADAASDL